jgi:hypothetical protein
MYSALLCVEENPLPFKSAIHFVASDAHFNPKYFKARKKLNQIITYNSRYKGSRLM